MGSYLVGTPTYDLNEEFAFHFYLGKSVAVAGHFAVAGAPTDP